MEATSEISARVETIKKTENDFVKTAEALGFVESIPMKDARRDAVAYLEDRKGEKDYAAFKVIYEYYCNMGEKIAQEIVHGKGIDQAKVQLGFLIMCASIYYLGGDRDLYKKEWEDIAKYAWDLRVFGLEPEYYDAT